MEPQHRGVDNLLDKGTQPHVKHYHGAQRRGQRPGTSGTQEPGVHQQVAHVEFDQPDEHK